VTPTVLDELDEAVRRVGPDPIPDESLRLARMRLEAGRWMVTTATRERPFVPDADRFAGMVDLPEIEHRDLDVEQLAGGLLFHGALVVRGFLTQDEVALLQGHLDSMLAARDSTVAEGAALGYSAVSPPALADLLAIYRSRGFSDTLRTYLGGRPVMHAHRIKLKRNVREFGLPWHQDGAYFLGRCQAVNAWVALTEVGANCPGLDIVPRRQDEVLGFTPEMLASLDRQPELAYLKDRSPQRLSDILDTTRESTPILQPGDAVMFDEMTLHRTGTVPWNVPSRDVALTWFFAPSRYPRNGSPVAL
jgi:Phytanoyl-CoA dioxygenase (PhyH)